MTQDCHRAAFNTSVVSDHDNVTGLFNKDIFEMYYNGIIFCYNAGCAYVGILLLQQLVYCKLNIMQLF